MIRRLKPEELLKCLQIEVDASRVDVTRHPTLPLSLYNYTPACQFDKLWNNINIWCRGLIVDDEGRIIAQPYKKFFNLEEYGNVNWTEILKDVVETTNKEDGSLIIMVDDNEYGLIIATRGSFTSSQAIAAREILEGSYEDIYYDCTYLFEYVAPDNRIVVYHPEAKLILHGINVNGKFVDYETLQSHFLWNFHHSQIQIVKPITISSLQDIKDSLDPNFEGVVCTRTDGERFKLKSNLYIKLHRIMTSVTEKNVFEVWYEADHSFPIDPSIPDEAYNQVREWIWAFHRSFNDFSTDLKAKIIAAELVLEEMEAEHCEVKEIRKRLAIDFPTLHPFLNIIMSHADAHQYNTQLRKLFTYEKYVQSNT